MKRIKLILLLVLICTSSIYAQTKPIYFDDNGVVASPQSATAYGVFGKLSDQELWVLKKFDFNDNLMVTGSYKDELLSVPHGKFVFYNSIEDFNYINNGNYNTSKTDRYVSQQGAFVNGMTEGIWYDYFPDGAVMHYANYKEGKLEGTFRTFSKKGKVEFMGQYQDGEKVGTWYDIVKREKIIFENGKTLSNSKLTRAEISSIQ